MTSYSETRVTMGNYSTLDRALTSFRAHLESIRIPKTRNIEETLMDEEASTSPQALTPASSPTVTDSETCTSISSPETITRSRFFILPLKLSPIHSLPVELVAMTIERTMDIPPQTTQDLIDRVRTAICLSHINSHWRQVALKYTPQIWSYALIDRNVTSSDLFNACVRRSGQCPLHVTIDLGEFGPVVTREGTLGLLEHPAIACRLKSLVARGLHLPHSWFANYLVPRQLERLELLYEYCGGGHVPNLSQARSLAFLRIDHAPLPITSHIRTFPHLKQLTWSNLCSNDLESWLVSLSRISWLAPYIEELTIQWMYLDGEENLADDFDTWYHFPHVQRLVVEGSMERSTAHFFLRLIAPRLEFIRVWFPFEYAGSPKIKWFRLPPPPTFKRVFAVSIAARGIVSPCGEKQNAHFALWLLRGTPFVQRLYIESFQFLAMWARMTKQGASYVPKLDYLTDLVPVADHTPQSQTEPGRNAAALKDFILCRGYPGLKTLVVGKDDLIYTSPNEESTALTAMVNATSSPIWSTIESQVHTLIVA